MTALFLTLAIGYLIAEISERPVPCDVGVMLFVAWPSARSRLMRPRWPCPVPSGSLSSLDAVGVQHGDALSVGPRTAGAQATDASSSPWT
jgi:hypothetical protein